MKIAVVGGTGLVGRIVVESLASAGHQPVVIARSTGVDVTTGGGLEEALAGTTSVVDVSNVTTMGKARSVAFFTAATGHLLEAEKAAGVEHHVVLSIVGIDRVALGYYEGKKRQEDLVLAGPVPATVLRATQFHEFAGQLLDRARGPVVMVPRMRTQPVAATEVAAALVALATGPAPEDAHRTRQAPELAGPEVLELTDLAREVARSRGDRRLLVPVRVPGRAGRAAAGGGLLPTADGPRGRQTFDRWLAESSGGPMRSGLLQQ